MSLIIKGLTRHRCILGNAVLKLELPGNLPRDLLPLDSDHIVGVESAFGTLVHEDGGDVTFGYSVRRAVGHPDQHFASDVNLGVKVELALRLCDAQGGRGAGVGLGLHCGVQRPLDGMFHRVVVLLFDVDVATEAPSGFGDALRDVNVDADVAAFGEALCDAGPDDSLGFPLHHEGVALDLASVVFIVGSEDDLGVGVAVLELSASSMLLLLIHAAGREARTDGGEVDFVPVDVHHLVAGVSDPHSVLYPLSDNRFKLDDSHVDF